MTARYGWWLRCVRNRHGAGACRTAEVIDDPLIIEPLSRTRLPVVIQQPAQRGLQFAAQAGGADGGRDHRWRRAPLLAYMLGSSTSRLAPMASSRSPNTTGWVASLEPAESRRPAPRRALYRRGHGESVMPTLTKFAVVDGDAEPTSRRISRMALGPDEQAVADAFVDARLLTSSVDSDGETVVGVAHEALLRQWTPLRDAIERPLQPSDAVRGGAADAGLGRGPAGRLLPAARPQDDELTPGRISPRTSTRRNMPLWRQVKRSPYEIKYSCAAPSATAARRNRARRIPGGGFDRHVCRVPGEPA